MTHDGPSVCARCGHWSLGCPHCERIDPRLGGRISLGPGLPAYEYCHTHAPQPSCYTLTLWEMST